MSGLNFNDHYATVYDLPGVRYQQNGRYYRPDGSPVEAAPVERVAEPDAPAPKVTNNGWTEDDLRRPENKSLQAQIAMFGVEWTTRKAAQEFLAGRG